MTPEIIIGSLVQLVNDPRAPFSDQKYRNGRLGIVTDIIYPIDHEMCGVDRIMRVLYSDTGEEERWMEQNLELVI